MVSFFRFLGVCILLCYGALLSGCASVVVGGGAMAGIVVAQERTVKDAANDTKLQLIVADRLYKHDMKLHSKVTVSVYEGRVLLTGIVSIEDDKEKAFELASDVHGIADVINEIKVREPLNAGGVARDKWVTTQLKTKFTFDKIIKSINYTVDTVDGTVYLMGVAQDSNELDYVIKICRNLDYVKNVVSYVRLKSEKGETETNFNYLD